MNWLSIRKVKLHGVDENRWTTKDKIIQYKGLIKLYNRDRKVIEFDNAIARKKQVKELKKLRKTIEENRNQLDNAIRGDRQQLRNALAEHKSMQLAYQQLHPIKVVENIHQANFNKRKHLDRLNYEKKQQSQKLIDLKLEISELQDRRTYDTFDVLPIERDAQIVTGKVQDAILKREAALAVKNTYMNIRDIMKKDALYFDVLLDSLKCDGVVQGKCMIRATELGQLATEYLDDRRQEFKELSRAVKVDMKERERNLQQARNELDIIIMRLKHLIRRDSDVNLAKVSIPKTESECNLQKCIEGMEEILTYLKNSLLVSNYDCIFPCLEEQLKQKIRLSQMTEKIQDERDVLNKKLVHAQLMRDNLYNTMCDTTFEYKSEKHELLANIAKENERATKTKELDVHRSNTLLKIRIGLKQLDELCNIIITPGDTKKTKGRDKYIRLSEDEEIVAPPPEETNGLKLIQTILPKLTKLVAAYTPLQLTPVELDTTMKHYQHLMLSKSRVVALVRTDEDELVEDEVLVDLAQIPNRDEIKRQSAAICEANINEDDLPFD